MNRRVLLAGAAAISIALPAVAQSETYPERPIRLLTPAAPGAANDALNRAVAGKLTQLLGQQVVVDNRPGAGATIAPMLAAKATPDGYTLLHCAVSDAIAPALYKRLPYDLLRDFSPIAMIGTTANILVVHPSVPARSVPEFIAYVKANPGKLAYASVGVGTSTHLSMELFKSITTTDMLHVPYKGGPLLIADLLAGRVSAMMSALPAQVDNVKAGKLRGLGVSTLKRNARLPDVPTIAESGVPDFDVTVWHGLCAPSAVPTAIIAKVSAELANAMNSAEMRTRLDQWGIEPQSLSSEQFTALIRSEIVRWAKVVKDVRIQTQ